MMSLEGPAFTVLIARQTRQLRAEAFVDQEFHDTGGKSSMDRILNTVGVE